MLAADLCDITLSAIISSISIKPSVTDLLIKKNTLHQQPKEKYYGNREYKRHLILEGKSKVYTHLLQKRCTQLLFRIHEGHGKAVYFIGVEDNGNINGLSIEDCIQSIQNFIIITEHIGVKINKMRIYTWLHKNEPRYCVIFKVAKTLDDNDCTVES
jgi:GTPase